MISVRFIKEHGTTFNKIWDFVEPQVRAKRSTLDRYKKDGIYACRLAGAGSFSVKFLLKILY